MRYVSQLEIKREVLHIFLNGDWYVPFIAALKCAGIYSVVIKSKRCDMEVTTY